MRLSYVYKNKGQIREKGVISTADWNKEHTESKIIENVAAWKLTDEIPAIDTKRATKPVTAKSQENPQATVKPEKKEVEIINAHNSKLDVEKGDYAIGADGKLRLISVDQADYSTKEDGKAFRGLKLSKTVVDALKKVGVMESLQLNEDEARTTFFADADVEKIDASISELDERIKKILSNYEGLADSLDDKKKAEATTTLESIANKVDEIEGKITSAIEQAKELSAAELNGQVDKVGAASKKFIDGCVGENGILTSIEKSLNVEEAKS